MKITKSYLRQVIKEELNRLNENIDIDALGKQVFSGIKSRAAQLGSDGHGELLTLGAALNKLSRKMSYQADPNKQDLVGTVTLSRDEQQALNNKDLAEFLKTATYQDIGKLMTAIRK